MKITIEACKTRFTATAEGINQIYFGDSAVEAFGEAVRNNLHRIPGLEIIMAPKSADQLKYEERRREASKHHGND